MKAERLVGSMVEINVEQCFSRKEPTIDSARTALNTRADASKAHWSMPALQLPDPFALKRTIY